MIHSEGEKKIYLVLGKRGSGKSYFVKKKLSEFNRYLVYDSLGEYQDGVVFEDIKSLGEFWKGCYSKNFKLVYRPLEPEEEFEQICSLVYACGNMVFVVEEIDRYCGSMSLGREFAHIVQRGRHKDITLIAISQRPYRVNRTLSSQVKELICFKQNEPRDIDFLSEFMGEDIEKVRTLPPYHYIHWRQEGEIEVKKEA